MECATRGSNERGPVLAMDEAERRAAGWTTSPMSDNQARGFAFMQALLCGGADGGAEEGEAEMEVELPDNDESWSLTAVAGVSMVVVRGDPGVTNNDEIIEREPHNPLLDIVDNPREPDLSEEEAMAELGTLLAEFSDVFVDKLPMDWLPPFRPVNHTIPLIDEAVKIRPRPYPMPDKYRAQ